MRLKTFLISIGIWVAILPHFGFSIAAENVLFSITGFVCIVASFYIAALEDRHRHSRVIHEKNITDISQKISKKLQHLKKPKVNSDVTQVSDSTKRVGQMEFLKEQEDVQIENIEDEDESRPRIKKAVSDVKINMDSIDDIVS